LGKDLKIIKWTPSRIEEIKKAFGIEYALLRKSKAIEDEINIRSHFNLYTEVFVEDEVHEIQKKLKETEQKSNDAVNSLILFRRRKGLD